MDKITEIRKKYFPEKSLSQILKMVQDYYKTDISAWSDEKIEKSLINIVEQMSKPEISNLVFNPSKAKYIQIILVDSEVVTIPVSEISKLLIDKDYVMTMYHNDELKERFQISEIVHTSESIVMKFEHNKLYDTKIGEFKGRKVKLTEALEKSVFGIRCIYPDGKKSYIIRTNWKGTQDKNKLQRVENEYGGIVLYLGNYAL